MAKKFYTVNFSNGVEIKEFNSFGEAVGYIETNDGNFHVYDNHGNFRTAKLDY